VPRRSRSSFHWHQGEGRAGAFRSGGSSSPPRCLRTRGRCIPPSHARRIQNDPRRKLPMSAAIATRPISTRPPMRCSRDLRVSIRAVLARAGLMSITC
jgi:hypothetical protein